MTDDQPGPLRRIALRGAALAGAGYLVSQVLNLVIYVVLARLLSPQEYGVFAAASLVVGVGIGLSGAGINAALIYRRDNLEEAANTALIAAIAGGLGVAALVFVTAPLLGVFFNDAAVGSIAAALALSAPLRSAAVVPDSLMQRRFSFVRRLIIEPAGVLLFGTVAVWGAMEEDLGPWALVLGTYASVTVRLFLSWRLAHWRPQLRQASIAVWLEIAYFARHVFAAEVLRRVTAELPALLLGRFSGTDSLGQFRYAERIGMLPHLVVTNVGSFVLFPALARISSDRERLLTGFLESLRWTAVLAFPMGLVFLPLGVPIAVVLLGAEWIEAGYGLMGLCAYTGARAVVSTTGELFKAIGEPGALPRMGALSTVTTVIAVVALFPFGLAGVAAGISLSSIVVAVYALWIVAPAIQASRRRIATTIAPPAAASAVMVVAVWLLDDRVLRITGSGGLEGTLMLGVGAVAAAVTYAASLAVFAPSLVAQVMVGACGVVRRVVSRRGRGRESSQSREGVIDDDSM